MKTQGSFIRSTIFHVGTAIAFLGLASELTDSSKGAETALPSAQVDTPRTTANSNPTLEEQEREIDKQHLQQIYAAIQAYRKKRGDLPNWLSDLVPEFLPDADVLLSPVEKRTGASRLFTYADPKLKSSYIYQFSASRAGGDINQNRTTPVSMKVWKSLQMEEFGPAIPILRCHLHDPVLNIAFSGEFYESTLFWESDPNTLAMMKRLGAGPGVKNQKTVLVKVVEAETEKPLAGVEVTGSNRQSELGPLPPRTVSTDAQGECQFPLGGEVPRTVQLSFRQPGYADAPIRWDSSESSLPSSFTAKLKGAATVGGRVTDKTGQPVSGVTVTVSGVQRDEVGQTLLVELDSLPTDSAGRWSTQRVPKDFSSLTLKLRHAEFLPAEYDRVDAAEPGEGEVTKADLLAGRAAMMLTPGIRVEGTVLGPEQLPVAGAQVTLRDISETPTNRVQRTDAKGHFRFVVLEPGAFQLVVQAPGYAPQFRPLEVESELKPMEFALSKGKTIKGRALDEAGKPVAGAVVSVGVWNDLPLLSWSTVADDQGCFTWDSAPEGTVVLSVSKPGLNAGTQRISTEIRGELTLRLVKSFLLSGKVLDADTKQPIPRFSIVRGFTLDLMQGQRVNWEFYDEKPGSDGIYTAGTLDRRVVGNHLKFMARADRYLPAASPVFPATGWHTFDFELSKGSGPCGVVKLATGEPVAGAEVALLGAGYLSLAKATFRNAGQRGSFVVKTDAQGRFSLPAAIPSPSIIAVHEQGYANLSAERLAVESVMTLQPWGRIDGVLKNGTRPAPEESVAVTPNQTGPSGLNFDFQTFQSETDREGRFSFTYLPPGECRLGRLVRSGTGWTFSGMQPVMVKAGAVTEMVLGGVGRPVIGKFVLSDSARKVDWNEGQRFLRSQFPRSPGGFKTAEEARAWSNSPEMIKARESVRSHSFHAKEDGSFRIENVLAGTYTLNVYLTEPSGDQSPMGRPIGSFNKEVEVSEIPGGVSDEPLDLGELTVQLRTPTGGP